MVCFHKKSKTYRNNNNQASLYIKKIPVDTIHKNFLNLLAIIKDFLYILNKASLNVPIIVFLLFNDFVADIIIKKIFINL